VFVFAMAKLKRTTTHEHIAQRTCTMTKKILHIDSSARRTGSVTRDLTAQIVAKLGGEVKVRDLAKPLPLLSDDWLQANWTDADSRTEDQTELLAQSDALIGELQAADTIVIGAPVYNFGVPAALKAWIDLIARSGLTFQYTETGPKGLLTAKKAIVVMASGGMKIGQIEALAA